MTVQRHDGRRRRPSKPTACDSSAAAARWPRRGDGRRRRAFQQRRLGARSRSWHPLSHHARSPSRLRSSTSSPASPRPATRRSALTEKYHDPHLADRVFELAWTHSQVLLRQLNATEADAQLYGRLAGSVIYANPALARRSRTLLASNRRGQSGLWGYGISGDLPIVLLRIRDLTQHRSGAPARAGARLLAHEGARRRSGHLERRRTRSIASRCRNRSWT